MGFTPLDSRQPLERKVHTRQSCSGLGVNYRARRGKSHFFPFFTGRRIINPSGPMREVKTEHHVACVEGG